MQKKDLYTETRISELIFAGVTKAEMLAAYDKKREELIKTLEYEKE